MSGGITGATTGAALSVRVRKALGGFLLDAGFEAPAGVTVLFGPSGSGKTSVVNAVAGLSRPDAGRIAVGGQMLYDSGAGIDLPAHRRRIGYVFQDARLFPHMTVDRNLAYGGTADRDRVISLLGLGGLLDRHPAALSGGETQRVALGRALMSDPRLLLLDEPMAGLDGTRKAMILPYLERLRDEVALPMLYVTHDVGEAARLGTTMVLMAGGQVRRVGPLADVLSDPEVARDMPGRDAGVVLSGPVTDGADGLVRVDTGAGPILVQGATPLGTLLRLRVPAQDVILSLGRPEGISALNVLPATVETLSETADGGIDVVLRAGRDRLLARITARSAGALGLEPGLEVHAIVKARALPG